MGRMVKVALGDDVLSAEIRAEAAARIHRNVEIDVVLIDMSVGALSLRIGDTAATANARSRSETFKLGRSDELGFLGRVEARSAMDSRHGWT
jgi:hypothetical protein